MIFPLSSLSLFLIPVRDFLLGASFNGMLRVGGCRTGAESHLGVKFQGHHPYRMQYLNEFFFVFTHLKLKGVIFGKKTQHITNHTQEEYATT